MSWTRSHRTTSSGRIAWQRVTVLLVVIGLCGLASPAARAYGPGNEPTIQVNLREGPSIVQGWNWTDPGDSSVTVRVNGGVIGTTAVSGGMFNFTFPGGAARPSPGDVVTVTGASGYVRSLTVTGLSVTRFDFVGNALHGAKGALPNWGDLMISFGNQFPGTGYSLNLTGDGGTSWSTPVDVSRIDLMAGVGAMLRQVEADGDTLLVARQVPNPTIRISSQGVSMWGWLPNSTLDVTLFNGEGQSYSLQTTTDANGERQGLDNIGDPEWEIIRPGWSVAVSGNYPIRDNGRVTKRITFPDLPLPVASGFNVSGTVTGALDYTHVGDGSLVRVNGQCANLPIDTPAQRVDFVAGGTYSVSFDEAVEQPWGFGGVCTEPVFYFSAQATDLDGDAFEVNQFADFMFGYDAPVLVAESPVREGQAFDLTGTGWDLSTIRIQQCELLDGGTALGACDPSTTLDTNTYPNWPDPEVPGDLPWPESMAEFNVQPMAQRFLNLDDGERSIDCATAPGTCGVVAYEIYRSGITAFTPLTFELPVWVDLDLTVNPTGTVSRASGSATITGTLGASAYAEGFDFVRLFGELRQRLGRKVVIGTFETWVPIPAPGETTTWSVIVGSTNSLAFGSGSAEVTMSADFGPEGGPTDGAYVPPTVVKLAKAAVPKPPRS